MHMPKMKVAAVSRPGADFDLTEREIPVPGPGQVRLRVQACGICFSDHLTKDGLFPGIQYPRVPGHEVAGVLDELGPGVSSWKKGQRVGVGWHAGHDFTCPACREGEIVSRSEEHTSELQSRRDLVCRLLLEKKNRR